MLVCRYCILQTVKGHLVSLTVTISLANNEQNKTVQLKPRLPMLLLTGIPINIYKLKMQTIHISFFCYNRTSKLLIMMIDKGKSLFYVLRELVRITLIKVVLTYCTHNTMFLCRTIKIYLYFKE